MQSILVLVVLVVLVVVVVVVEVLLQNCSRRLYTRDRLKRENKHDNRHETDIYKAKQQIDDMDLQRKTKRIKPK